MLRFPFYDLISDNFQIEIERNQVGGDFFV